MIKPILLSTISLAVLSSCATTSLSDPNGSGHNNDLSLYGLTGQSSSGQVTEADIAAASRGGSRKGSLPARGAKVLLVQSGAHQPDEELLAAFKQHCEPVIWDGRDNADNDGSGKPAAASEGRRLRLVAAQQGCSHVVVIYGEIQSDSQSLGTGAINWVPLVGNVIPAKYSGTRLLAQAIILETTSTRYTTVTATPKESRGITTDEGSYGINGRRARKMKVEAYPELAGKCFR